MEVRMKITSWVLALLFSLPACGGGGGEGDGGEEVRPDDFVDDTRHDFDDGEAPQEPVAEPDARVDTEAEAVEDPPADEIDPGTLLGQVRLTYYYVAFEGDYSCASPDTQIGTCSGEVIATVCADFADSARMEGTARLLDGTMINIGCSCGGGFDCFVVLDPAQFPWGMGNRGNALVPFVSAATDTSVIAGGTILYSPEIAGVPLPEAAGGGIHDGCLRADDTGGAIVGMHIDFFVALREYYLELDPLIPENVTLYRDPVGCGL
jgi:3D (Asp-Asp-Asp) domain-containing protein